ncbi:DUF721 domain-containing protein [Brachybacterium phenoliresistens]|uniref:DUF721 domain-containing protein n=1 Tax=Brachybacterium phenoliresistens TaxID=396014 RepID=UPI0031CF8298
MVRPQGGAPNPYDLSTWRRPEPSAPSGPGVPERPADPERPSAPERRGAAARPAAARPAASGRRPGPALPPADADPAAAPDPDGPREDPVDPDPADPPELARPDDPFELARRTVNRSRAAARDRGLFPISRATQARGPRDRSTHAPGYSGARPDPRDPQGIELVLRRVLGDLGWDEGVRAGRVLEEWDTIVGEQVAQHCRPVSLDEGVLVVSASSSAWATQLRMISAQLITAIEEHVGAHVISELKVTGPAAQSWKKGRRTVTWRGPRDTYG